MEPVARKTLFQMHTQNKCLKTNLRSFYTFWLFSSIESVAVCLQIKAVVNLTKSNSLQMRMFLECVWLGTPA